jgi:capsular polysaccharide export protein
MTVGPLLLPATVHAAGFSRRKRAIVRRFVAPSEVVFVGSGRAVSAQGTLLLWGSAPAPDGLAPSVRVVRMEDGFLRSVGLGADLVAPVSWVLDDEGIYYDATRPSRLERLLREAVFEGSLLARAAVLRARICAAALTKYNVGSIVWQRPAAEHRVILVPGQVESDASIRFGAPGIRTNIDLLKATRESNPDAWVVYKPHPDVIAGLRKAGVGEREALRWCNEMVTDVSMAALLDAVDEVHVLTSLAGFEALLRDRQVVCHGMPFYAGWGLTRDALRCDRRGRTLTIDELVAGALILYPAYVSRATGLHTTPEAILGELVEWRGQNDGEPTGWRTMLRWLLRLRAN